MRAFWKLITGSFFSVDVPLRGRLINICFFLCTIGGICAAISTFIQASSALAVTFIMMIPIGTTILQFWVRKTGKYRAAGFFFTIVLCDITFPIIFFVSGGIYSGMMAYFILGSVILFLLLGDDMRDCIIMTVVFLVVNSACIIFSYYNPSSIIPIQNEAMLYMDIVVALIISTILVEVVLWFQTRMYKNAQQTAEEAMKAKDEFLASMSHELRTPLNAIIGLSEIQMKMKDSLPESSQEDIKNIYESGTTLLRIINDVLDISKIGSGKFELSYSEYKTADMINDTISMNKVRIGDKPIEFIIKIAPDLPSVLFGDELRIRQIMNNILSNAFKYTESGVVEMDICGIKHDDLFALDVKISDTGIGIKKEDIPSLFSKYNKLDDAATHSIEGTGLGLSITRDLLQMMGSDIEIDSTYGAGSSFSFQIPQKVIDIKPIGAKTSGSLATFSYRDKEYAQQEFKYTSFKGKRALIVDDVEINLYITREMLSPYDLVVDLVESGKKVVALVREAEAQYDVIFMDQMMPEMDGIEATRIIREEIGTEYAKKVPIVALTANALVGSKELFLKNGFQQFLTKPMDLQELDVVLKEVLL